MEYKKEISEKMHKLLRYEWNPIGLNDNDPQDEYDFYASNLVSYCWEFLNSVSDDKLTNILYAYETKDMWLDGDKEQCRYIAQEILKVYWK